MNPSNLLIIGGAGYVGSAVAAGLIDRGHRVWILDDLSTGHRQLALGSGFTKARAGDRETLDQLFTQNRFDCVMHFAASSQVAESVAHPEKYRENNVEQTRALVQAMLDHGIRRLVFSSTCAVFGDPGDREIDENLPKAPINPYGESKLEAERMLEEFARTRGLQTVVLRYFNAAGAEKGLRVGEWHQDESHLIPRVLEAARNGLQFQVFGSDYPTPDGTAIRDYVHVSDLATAHEAAMQKLLSIPADKGDFRSYNLGTEKGMSVLEVIAACERATGKKIAIKHSPRRPGDPPRLVAKSDLARRELGFQPKLGIDEIVSSAWKWAGKLTTFQPAVFLDRDGTINHDPGYLSKPEQLTLIEGVGDALKQLKEAGFRLVVVSNQSGVGRGLIRKEDIPIINARLDELIKPFGVSIDRYELCFHLPQDGCECRKPSPKLLIDGAQALGIDLTRSFMVGDKASDVRAGLAASCQGSILVRTGEGKRNESVLANGEASHIADSLVDAASWIVRKRSQSMARS